MKQIERKPSWLKIKLPTGEGYTRVSRVVKEHGLHTICSSGMCPNIGECWGNGTATFMILGDICSRACRFCATASGKALPPSDAESTKVAESVKLMKLRHCVITSVTRDDLPDEGAQHWHDTITEVRSQNPSTKVEVLIPDFNGNTHLLDIVLKADPDIVAHNLETVERLTPSVRSRATYQKSLSVIAHIAKNGYLAKSGIMVGLGETPEEVELALSDLASAGCKAVTIGQYLQPRGNNLPVVEYVTPETFDKYKAKAVELGFRFVESGPLVRSSYHAEESAKQSK
ncbi:lipoyl synthase [Perlabentimonas gracilis]|uniref:lipoyl synthase n=1 Tax=Perlabentimonas gracilis TaxID=2715279 RepID=UPI00140803C5|nr:lipoyl synthase [Perlabentimonas gracilis]NHB69876.1 lipoyl synthase [Perlabentimonas gracilis]